MKTIIIVGIGAVALAMANVSQANIIPIINGDFNQVSAGSSFVTIDTGNSSYLPGWTVTGSIDLIGGYWNGPAGQGDQSIDMNGYFAAGTIAQTVAIPYAGIVHVNFMLAGNTDNNPNVKTIGVSLISPYSVQSFMFDTSGRGHNNMGWVETTATFDVAVAGDYTLQFSSMNDPRGAFGPALADVSVTIPDGGLTVLLLGMGLLSLGWVRSKCLVLGA